MLAVEFDGEQHDPVQDSRRDSKLQVLGIETLRVPNREFLLIDVSEEPNKDWVEAIVRRCEERAGRQVPR